jgi:hypothetical protein
MTYTIEEAAGGYQSSGCRLSVTQRHLDAGLVARL